MNDKIAGMSARNASTLIGLMYVALIIGGLFAIPYARGQIVVAGDVEATIVNILDNQFLYRLGYAVSLTYLTCAFIMVWALYHVLRPVNDALALLAFQFGVVATALEAINLVNHYVPLRILTSDSFSHFDDAHIQAIVHVFPRLFSTGLGISLVFFGIFCVLTGYLMFRSALIPRFLGVLYALAGLSYLVSSFAGILSPQIANILLPYILAPALAAPFCLAYWFLFRGIRS